MVMENGGLDAQVEQRMDAYRGNPQKLQQRYGKNKELLDLLALQKLTSEKKAVAADMQLKQSQQPGTIAQQREQEALDLTKQEMGGTLGDLAGRTKGTLDNKQMMQQKNMQKMAQAASRPPQAQGGIGGLMGGAARPQPRPAAPPQAQGIAGARMAQAQQRPPVRMAQGGIVSFAEGQEVEGNTPFGRWWRKTTAEIGEDAALSKLRQQVKTKFGTFASPMGALRNQSDEQRQYAKNVLSNVDTMSADQLIALSTSDFATGMTPEALSALPTVASQRVVTPDTTANTGPVDPNSSMPTVAPVTFEAREPYKTEVSKLSDADLNVSAVSPTAPSTAAVTAAQDSLLATIGETPEPLKTTDTEFAKLAPVEAEQYLTEDALAARGALLNKAEGDIGADPQAAIEAARASADQYSGRGINQQISADQLAKEQAFIDRTMDPERVAQRQRMETYGGGAKYGRGGIGRAFLESQDRSDAVEAGGLARLREIQQAGINNDMSSVNIGSTAGESAGSRAQADTVNAANIFGSEVTSAGNAAVTQQTLQQGVNTANAATGNAASLAMYRAEVEAINNESAARREILDAEARNVSDQTKLAISTAGNSQDALTASAENAITRAKETDAFVLELEKINQLDEDNAYQLYYDQLNMLREEKNLLLDGDRNAMVLRNKVAQAETESEVASATDALIAYEDAMENILAQRFAFDYAKLTELRARADNLRSQRISASSPAGPIDVDDPTISVDPVQ